MRTAAIVTTCVIFLFLIPVWAMKHHGLLESRPPPQIKSSVVCETKVVENITKMNCEIVYSK